MDCNTVFWLLPPISSSAEVKLGSLVVGKGKEYGSDGHMSNVEAFFG